MLTIIQSTLEVEQMGILNRLKQAPSGVGEAIDDVRSKGFIGGIISTLTRVGEKNSAAVKTIGDDIGRR